MTLSPVTVATMCDRYDCGHISRSSSRPVKRAIFLYRAEDRGLGYLGSREDAHTLAALSLMREGATCREVLLAGGEGAAAIEASAPATAPLTPRQCEVLARVAEGDSFPEIAAHLSISVETVRSLSKAAMRATLTHSVVDAAVSAAEEGLI